MRPAVRSLLATLALAACSTLVGETPVETSGPPTTPASTSTTTTTSLPEERVCTPVRAGTTPVATGSLAGDALALSREIFPCSDQVVVVAETDLTEVALAAQLAAALGGPVLHPSPDLAAELERLAPLTIHIVGGVEVKTPEGTEVLRPNWAQAASMAGEELGVTNQVPLPAVPEASTVVETIAALTVRDRVAAPTPGATSQAPAVDAAALIRGLTVPTGSEFAWLVPATQPALALTAAAMGQAIGASVVAYDPADLLAYPELSSALSGRPPSAIRYLGVEPPSSSWEIDVLLRGVEVPGGGYRILPATTPRRYVALYGNPYTTGLGALGEQGPADSLARMQPLITEYGADGSQVIPTFEIIASVASAGPTDGDYSEEWDPTAFQEWVRFAGENGLYVVLDLQPGREDFLTQAKQYEELLRLPYVGLALDPEWRLLPDQVHLRQVGQVQAAEVNTVVDWLADLVRDNGLPQKLLLVHQFKFSMIVDRETLKQRPELQMVIQMDGQGPIPTKDETYAVLTAGTEEAHWRWGWKNFYDEDSPETASPAYTINRAPIPVYVSYQ
ncbi:MAG TPA: hypothetical protein VFP67_04385 [Acidimicrobiia bacterium]|nr:hypothetical protein [Acidimicrobiia bacterium]